MSNFALNTTDPYGDVISSINYVLANLGSTAVDGNVLIANVTTGEITSNSTVVSYLYQYMDVQYANSSTGGSGFSSNSQNRSYFGLRNTANATPISFNPTDYVWYQVTGGFGTTKSLFYQTIGGRQIAFFAGNSAPVPSYISVPDMPTANSTPLNLDTITSAQNNQIVNVNAYYQANIAPATPSGGTYNFTTFALTAPAGWSANIPTSGNTSTYVSTAAFTGNSNATAAPPATTWTVPALYTSQFQGNTGPAGTRGFVPMGFVITASDPTTYSNAQLTTAYSSSRTNASPPIGLGFAPIQYDTSQFAYQNLFTGNTTTIVKQYDGSGWVSVVGNVISGGLFVPGSINANTLNANQVYALTVASTNANVGNVQSNGFWLQSGTGDARLAGNTTIGNNLTIGNNAVIGGNLSVTGLITQGALANAVVTTATLVDGAITGIKIAAGTITGNLIQANTITGNLIQANTITGNNIQAGSIYGNSIVANSFTANTINGNAITAGSLTLTGNINSANSAVGDPAAPGYWLAYNNGSARFGGNVSIGNNLTVANLITTSALNASTVSTNVLVINSATQQVFVQDDPAVNSIQFINGTTSNIASPDYLWPNNTRGFGVGGGATIIPSTTGNVGGSGIQIVYTTYITSLSQPTYNLVELWKSGGSSSYTNSWLASSAEPYDLFTPITQTWDFVLAGTNGQVGWVSGNANTFNRLSSVSNNATITADLHSVISNDSVSTGNATPGFQALGSQTAYWLNPYVQSSYRAIPINTNFNVYSSYVVLCYPYGFSGVYQFPGIAVGNGGQIYRIAGYQSLYSCLAEAGTQETSGVFADLYSVANDIGYVGDLTVGSSNFITSVVVGTGGTILENQRSYNVSGFTSPGVTTNGTVASTTGWSTAVSNVTVNLNSVACNSFTYDRGNAWVIAGDSGTILTATSTAGNPTTAWTPRTSNTSQNLNAVAECLGRWVAVGNNGTIITSTNAGATWSTALTNPADGSGGYGTRNLTTVTGNNRTGRWIVGGQELVMISNGNDPTAGWQVLYAGGASYKSQLTRLAFNGSWSNIANVSQPPAQQQISNQQVISGSYVDYNYTAGNPVTYYLVLGNMAGDTVYTGGPSLLVTEIKR
jgi:hypothetical protein